MTKEELIEKVVEGVKGREGFNGNTYNSIFATITPGGRIKTNFETQCYGGLRGCTSKLAYIATSIQDGYYLLDERSKKYAIQYLDYLFNHSIFSELFVEKDASEVLSKRIILVDGSKPLNLVLSGLIACRVLSEHQQHYHIFGALVDEGLEPHTAFYVSYIFSCDGKGTSQVRPSNSGNHRVFDPESIRTSSILDARKGVYHNAMKPFGWGETWSWGDNQKLLSREGKRLDEIAVVMREHSEEEVEQVDLNPFRRPVSNNEDQFTFDDCIKSIVETYQKTGVV